MIIRNGKLTGWDDALENLLKAAHEAAFNKDQSTPVELKSEDHQAAITARNGTAITTDRRLFNLALQDGWWIIDADPLEFNVAWEILFNWPKDPAKPPSNEAMHITRTVIPLSEAERRWGLQNLRQNAVGRLNMWKAGPRVWFTTEQAMIEEFGPEPK